MSLLNDYRRVTRSQRCPICNHGDWCLVSREGKDDPVSVICPRVESETPLGGAGWLHHLHGERRGRRSFGTELPPLPPDHREEAERLAKSADLRPWADRLGVPVETMQRLLVGQGEDKWGPYTSWPQFDPNLRVVGISLRRPDGSKQLRLDDRAGLHLPLDLPLSLAGERVLVVEGGSDAAAGLALGAWSIGRHSVLSGFKEIRRLLRSRRPGRITVVADRDPDDRGLRAACRLADELRSVCPQVGVVVPPEEIKDLRAWIAEGVGLAEVLRGEEVLA